MEAVEDIFKFGKHADESIQSVVKGDYQYINWFLNQDDFDPVFRERIAEITQKTLTPGQITRRLTKEEILSPLKKPEKLPPTRSKKEQLKRLNWLIDLMGDQHRPSWDIEKVHSFQMQDLRRKLLVDCPECFICGRRGVRLDMHHKHYNTWEHETRADVVLLDRKCHTKVTRRNTNV